MRVCACVVVALLCGCLEVETHRVEDELDTFSIEIPKSWKHKTRSFELSGRSVVSADPFDVRAAAVTVIRFEDDGDGDLADWAEDVWPGLKWVTGNVEDVARSDGMLGDLPARVVTARHLKAAKHWRTVIHCARSGESGYVAVRTWRDGEQEPDEDLVAAVLASFRAK